MIDNREELATKMIDVLNSRGGFDDWWSNIDEECKEEIIAELVHILPIQIVVKSLPDDEDAVIAIKQQLKSKGYRSDV